MSRRSNSLTALSICALAILASPNAIAGPAGVSEPGNTDWRALFQSAKYNKPCPLTVYSEDMSGIAPSRRAALSPLPEPGPERRSTKAASDIIRDYAHGADFVGIDDLAAYGDDFSRPEKL